MRQRICLGFDSFGLILHHSAASLFICMMLTGVIRPEQSVFDPCLILCVQHGFTLLQYFHRTLYILILFILEVFFEWMVISNFELYAYNHWTAELAALTMLISHWIWFCTAATALICDMPSFNKRTNKAKVLPN